MPQTSTRQAKPADFGTERVCYTSQLDDQLIGDLIAHQNRSWQEFADVRLKELFAGFSPLEVNIKKNDQNHQLSLSFKDYFFEEPKMTDQEALRNNVTYEASLKVNVELHNRTSGKKRTQEVYLGDYPWMTDRGTFVINGTERVVVTQIIRSPGVFFEEIKLSADQKLRFNSEQIVFGAHIIPDRGSSLRIETSPRDGVIFIVINHRHRLPVTNFLLALGMEAEEIRQTFAGVDRGSTEYIKATFDHRNSVHDQNSALIEVYKCIRPGDLANIENAREALNNKFFSHRQYDLSKVGRYKINQRLGLDTPNDLEHRVLGREDFIAIITEVIRLNNTPGAIGDDIDDLSNRRLRLVGELLQRPFRMGLMRMERNITERMLRLNIDTMAPQQLINARPIVVTVKAFFASNQLSQYMDQTNPLSELAHKRRLSAVGLGGLKREYAKFAVRDSHATHYGRICPVETPEGANVGLILYMSLFSRINQYGFLETPCWRVLSRAPASAVAGEIARLDLKGKDGKVIVAAGAKISPAAAAALAKADPKKLWPLKARVLRDKMVYLDASEEKQALIISADAEVDERGYFKRPYEAGRQRSIAGHYDVSRASHADISAKQIIGSSAGLIPFVEKDQVGRSLVGANQARQAVPLIDPKPPIVATGLEKHIARNSGQIVYAEEAGKVVEATAEKVVVEYPKLKLKQTYPLTHFVRSNYDTAIHQRVVVDTGQKVAKGQPLIEGMSIAGGELALGRDVLVALAFWGGYNFEDAIIISERLVKEDILTSINITEYSVEVRDTKLGPEITTLDIPNVSEEALRHLDETGIIRIGAQVRPGDILVGKITPKGEQELSNEERLLRAIFGDKAKDVRDTSLKLPNGGAGKVVGVSIFSKEQGHELRAGVLMQIQIFIAQSRKIQIGDKLAGRHGNKGVISRILPVEDMPFTEDGQPIDLIFNPLGIASRMNIGQLFEAHLGAAAAKLGFSVVSPALDGVSQDKIAELLKQAGLPEDGKQQLYDGRTGKPFDERMSVGYMYIYKLAHMVSDKIHVRSTGPYAMITQQPLRGKSHHGGQRFGEMEVWVLEAYGAAHTLQEMLTLKSDDITGRFKVYESIVKQIDIVSPRVPESFNILVKELQGLCLKIDLVGPDNQLVNTEDILEAGSNRGRRPAVDSRTEARPPVELQPASEPAAVVVAEAAEGEAKGDSMTAMIEEDLDFESELKPEESAAAAGEPAAVEADEKKESGQGK